MLQQHGWSVYWTTDPYTYLFLDFQSQSSHVRNKVSPDITLLVYPETLSQLLLVDGDAREILIEEFYREQYEQLFRKSM